MQIAINATPTPFSDGKYTKLELAYSRDGKDQTRKFARVGKSADIFDVLAKAQKGEVYEVNVVKDGEYWNWTSAVKVTSGGSTASATQARSTSTYETPEERKIKQLFIARQSSLAQAVVYHGSKAPVTDILKTAQTFVDFVYSNTKEDNGQEGEDNFE